MNIQRFGIFAVALGLSSLVGSRPVQAQRATTISVPHMIPVHRPAPTTIVNTGGSRLANRISAAPSTRTSSRVSPNDSAIGGSFLSVSDLLNPLPPPGFNFEDLAAFNRDLDIKAVIDPVTEWRLAVAERLLRDSRFVSPGFFLLDGGGAFPVPVESPIQMNDSAQPAQQPQVIFVQASPAAALAPAAQVPQAALEETAQLQDVGQFVLVLKNRKEIQAVAFTRVGDRVIYITSEGLRHTLAFADLDSESTRRINEERGTPIPL
jgi:hypothetical protein